MKEFWNERYSQKEYVYGINPNEYIRDKLEELKASGNILFPAEGEGRNAVYAALQGLNVIAFDISNEAKDKALRLAQDNNVKIDYRLGSFEDVNLEENYFDYIVLTYAHFPPALKAKYYSSLHKYLKPGGKVIVEGFSKNHLKVNDENEFPCGPNKPEMLFSIEEFKEFFNKLETIELVEEVIELSEGKFHKGKGSVIRFIGSKK